MGRSPEAPEEGRSGGQTLMGFKFKRRGLRLGSSNVEKTVTEQWGGPGLQNSTRGFLTEINVRQRQRVKKFADGRCRELGPRGIWGFFPETREITAHSCVSWKDQERGRWGRCRPGRVEALLPARGSSGVGLVLREGSGLQCSVAAHPIPEA